MSTASEITRLQTIKTNIRSALVYKGIEAASAHDMEDFEADILAIETKPYAVIGVTYPSGSICTCSNGTKTLTAEGTDGLALFAIPSSGTWTITSVSGARSATRSVAITKYKQVETVYLDYIKYIFKTGSGAQVPLSTSLKSSATTITISNANIKITYSGGSNVESAFWTTSKVDVTAYTKLVVDVASYNMYYASGRFGASASASALSAWSTPSFAKVYDLGGGSFSSPKTLTLDITSLTGSYYLGWWGINNATITNMYLN